MQKNTGDFAENTRYAEHVKAVYFTPNMPEGYEHVREFGITHPNCRDDGALLRNKSTGIFVLWNAGSMIMVPQDWAKEHADAGKGEVRIIVAGSRDFNDYQLLSNTLSEIIKNKGFESFPDRIKIVSGTARGADTLGEMFARANGYAVIRFPADWMGEGRPAGLNRNERMAEYAAEPGKRGMLVAFWDGCSRGTIHMINIARRCGLEVHVVRF